MFPAEVVCGKHKDLWVGKVLTHSGERLSAQLMPAALGNSSDGVTSFLLTHAEHREACFSHPPQVAGRGTVKRTFTNTI